MKPTGGTRGQSPAGKPAIVARGVTKEFTIPHERRTTLFENITGAFRRPSYEKFVALKDISISIERGESVGIIGDNGSGKSTLLKVIANIIRPSGGEVEVNGRITPFLELGVGFQSDLTVCENIGIYSTIMGMNDREIAAGMDDILEFAGLSRFRDARLKNLSSGMQARLAFSTAVQKTPDILLMDEVLAVGDMDFREKCINTFKRFKDEKVTMVMVSHDLNAIREFCDRSILLKHGELIAFEATDRVIDRYIYGEMSANYNPPAGESAAADLSSPRKYISLADEACIGPGWYDLEVSPAGTAYRWQKKQSFLYVDNDKAYTKLKIRYITNIELEIKAYINGQISKKILSDRGVWQMMEVPVSASGNLEIRLEVNRTWIPDRLLNNGDKRELGIAIEKIWLERQA
jgi:ABC-type polysaccharide/polyol phosphate transport system ATPase subunit